MDYYFAYGSNMHIDWMAQRCPDSKPLGAAKLSGYQLGFRYPSTSWPGGGACDIIASPQAATWGGLYQTNASDLLKLDDYEDVKDGGYRRIKVTVQYRGRPIEAVSYEVCDKLAEDLKPMPGYIRLVLEGGEQQGLPSEYLEALKAALTGPPR